MTDGEPLVVFLCDGPTCGDQLDSERLRPVFAARIVALGLTGEVVLARETCFGFCQRGPNVMIAPAALCRGRAPLVGTPRAIMHHGVGADAIDAILAGLRGPAR